MPLPALKSSLLKSTVYTAKGTTVGLLIAGALGFVPHGPAHAAVDAPQGRLPTIKDGTVEFQALDLRYDDKTGDVIAKGNVKLVREGYVLEAGQIRYNQETGKAIATGAVKMSDPEGNVIWSDTITLENELKDAFVSNIRLILKDGAQLAAKSAARSDEEGTITLDRAVYSPCKVCENSGKDPMWQLKAVKVVHDKGKKRLYYTNAFIEIFGVPVMWLPKFSHPDPTVDRANGLLPVELRSDRQLGLIVGLPYHHLFNKSSDLTVTPYITSKEGVVVASEYRQHFGAAQFKVAGSITNVNARNKLNQETGEREFRGHIFGEGTIKHNKNWLSSVDINWASDDTYLRRYDFSRADTLTSQYQLEGFYDNAYISARTIAFQGLRQEDISGTTGQAMPLLEADYTWDKTPIGGRLTVSGNALMIHRSDSVDSQRLSLSANWQRRDVLNNGLVVELESLLRTDVHALKSDINFVGVNTDYTRSTARVTGRLSFPLVKYSAASTHVIEPIVEISLSPKEDNLDFVINEDARAFELNEYNLFDSDRIAGSDIWETGPRFTYGVKYNYAGADWNLSTIIGQSHSFSSAIDLTPLQQQAGGLRIDDFSDIVAQINLNIADKFQFSSRMRFDEATFDIRRHDIEAAFNGENSGFDIRYLKLKRGLTVYGREDREEIRASGRVKLKNNWWISSFATEDLSNGRKGVEYGAGIDYRDDCMSIGLEYRRNFTRDRDVAPGRMIMLRIKLRNLG